MDVRVTDDLPETTSIHWHGMHVAARFDGGPHQPIAPATTWEPSWKVAQPAATLWYHPHPHGSTQVHTYRGLAGLVLVDDETSDDPGLPHGYGIDDLPPSCRTRPSIRTAYSTNVTTKAADCSAAP
ncbi:multicopper oxidase domain-containing protein [Kitasatospora sp. NPDC085895]|uniref:multicopper oxidase domain-containing protein n=1 Tax=Kitasatospora sp. NPDC085895 TaxID=3155057 RepID=UPI00344B7BA6